VFSEGDVTPSHYFKKGKAVTKVIFARSDGCEIVDGRSYVFQQNGALSHTSHLIQIGSQTTS